MADEIRTFNAWTPDRKDVEIARLRSVIVGCEIALNRDDDVSAVRRLLVKERHANGY